METMVLRVRTTLTQFPTNIPCAPSCIVYKVCDASGTCGCCCLGIASRTQFLKKNAWLLHPAIGDKAPPAERDSSQVTCALNRLRYPHTGNGGHNWCLGSTLFLSVGFSIQDEAMDAARSAPQGARCHVDIIACCYCC